MNWIIQKLVYFKNIKILGVYSFGFLLNCILIGALFFNFSLISEVCFVKNQFFLNLKTVKKDITWFSTCQGGGVQSVLAPKSVAALKYDVGKIPLQVRPLDTEERVFEIITAIILSIILFPPFILAFIVTLIFQKLYDGPIFYCRETFGLDGKPLKIWKLGTMSYKQMQTPASGKEYNRTPIGRFISKYRIDECPQLLMLFTGKLRLFGPRPLEKRDISPLRLRVILPYTAPGLIEYFHAFGEERNIHSDEIRIYYNLLVLKNRSLKYHIRQLIQMRSAMFDRKIKYRDSESFTANDKIFWQGKILELLKSMRCPQRYLDDLFDDFPSYGSDRQTIRVKNQSPFMASRRLSIST